jgi:hypothetical protein
MEDFSVKALSSYGRQRGCVKPFETHYGYVTLFWEYSVAVLPFAKRRVATETKSVGAKVWGVLKNSLSHARKMAKARCLALRRADGAWGVTEVRAALPPGPLAPAPLLSSTTVLGKKKKLLLLYFSGLPMPPKAGDRRSLAVSSGGIKGG